MAEVIAILQGITVDRALLVVFVAGTLYERFKATRASLRDQGKRVGAVEGRVTAIEAKLGMRA